MNRVKLILIISAILILITLLVAAVLQNLSPAPVRFLFMDMNVPVIVIIIVSLFCGFLLGLLFSAIFSRRWKKDAPRKELKKTADGGKNNASAADDRAMSDALASRDALKKPAREKHKKR